jgi:hypothetical protein
MVREYPHHWEYISDFTFMEDKKQLIATSSVIASDSEAKALIGRLRSLLVHYSGDGTLSVIDVRSNNATPLDQSEDQEDELLSIVPIKGYVL